MANESNKNWQKKTLAYQLLGIGKARSKLTPDEKKQKFREAMDNGPVGVWIKILGLGPLGKAVWVGLGILGLLIFIFGEHIFVKA